MILMRGAVRFAHLEIGLYGSVELPYTGRLRTEQ